MERTNLDLGLVVGANLKRLIRQSEYKTQEAFAFGYGVDVRTVGRWVNHGLYDVGEIQRIIELFGVDVAYIFSP